MVTVPSHVELDVRLREHFPTTRTLRFFFAVRPFYFFGGHSFYLL
jgi:hypothetical protein